MHCEPNNIPNRLVGWFEDRQTLRCSIYHKWTVCTLLSHRGDRNVADVSLYLELSLQFSLLHVVEGDDADVGVDAVSMNCSPGLFDHPRNLSVVRVAL